MAYGTFILLTALVAQAGGAIDADEPRRLMASGRYAEADEAYDALAKAAREKPDGLTPDLERTIALGKAEAKAAQGESDEAIEILKAAEAGEPKSAKIPAKLAELHFQRGRWEAADEAVARASAIDADDLLGRWVAVRLLESRGELEKAVDACKWFVDRYNTHRDEVAKDAEALILIGQAAERYYRASARGEELAEALNDVINEIYEGALRADPTCWKAPWLEGRLFLAGYNERAASKELARASQLNPLAPEVLVTRGQADLQGYRLAAGRAKAERALAVNPQYAPAHVLIADLNISDERFADALEAAKKAVAANPRDEDALARLAASCRLLVDPAGAAAAELIAVSNNPRPANFYAALAERLADRRKYFTAERAFLLAAQADPGRADVPIGLGMLYMQIGREDEASSLFNSAFAADPFNVRADNMMKVLKHMSGYKALESEHFVTTYVPGQDELLARYMSEYLESVMPELTAMFGYTPPGRTKIEIMKDHQWFSGRTVALPFIPTVGACTGKVVAMASPRSTNKPYNWARVIKHEFVHVVTLQQTEFNIPHWYTEALAVESEGGPRPQEWNKLLLERVPARKKLMNLDDINLGFIRPDEADDRQMAYCQAQLYAQYMAKRFGPDAQIKMLAAYRRGLTTARAIQECFHVDKEDFEKQYLAHLDEVVKTIRTRVDAEEPIKFSQLERELKAKPDDADLNAKMAYEHFARRDLKAARPPADKALELKPHHPLASYVKARLLTSIGDDDAALALLEPALDPEHPDERVVDLLADLTLKAGRLDEAERLYETARKGDPRRTKWIANLARVHLRQKRTDAFLEDLAQIAENDADNLSVRTNLAERWLAAGDAAKAEKWARECLYVDVYSPTSHVLLADALAASKKSAEAVEEYRVALELKPKKPDDLKVKLARAQLDMGRKDDARATLDEVLKADPEHPEAKALREEADRGPAA
ncbi:tetratricopeptide repeat protein [Planctomyces sp. SH-PL62]|uniref:tetratricopeptide repeat protein n=1 Tax=Planctomyces sp. SH-PL62 TaxID=1636152 RepID=UPI00078BA2E7|nr:tetratricopeptide repeat protein [Planctomyces sp. SH-PL62]AMV36281.1 tetratricopeptide repeat protein [Planctomyces sp. SH-PL62]